MQRLVHKLKSLKVVVSKRDKERKCELKKELISVEIEIEGFYKNYIFGTFSNQDQVWLTMLENIKLQILKVEVDTQRLKRREILLSQGDLIDTKFFHKFVENRRVQNLIWDLQMIDI